MVAPAFVNNALATQLIQICIYACVSQLPFDQVPLFFGIKEESLPVMLNCIGFKIEDYSKDDFISIEGERLQYIGIVISGTVDMIKEDFWGNKTILIRMKKGSLFGEAFICGSMDTATVSFRVTEKAKILFLPLSVSFHWLWLYTA